MFSHAATHTALRPLVPKCPLAIHSLAPRAILHVASLRLVQAATAQVPAALLACLYFPCTVLLATLASPGALGPCIPDGQLAINDTNLIAIGKTLLHLTLRALAEFSSILPSLLNWTVSLLCPAAITICPTRPDSPQAINRRDKPIAWCWAAFMQLFLAARAMRVIAQLATADHRC